MRELGLPEKNRLRRKQEALVNAPSLVGGWVMLEKASVVRHKGD